MDLTDAQASKHDLICRKLGLAERPGARLLDVGCGWGSMAIHAATHYDVTVVGITISESQADLARKRVAEAGVGDRVEIRLQDYRELARRAVRRDLVDRDVRARRGEEPRPVLQRSSTTPCGPQGRLLNHAISSVGGSRMGRTSFIGRYVFPDGELIDVGERP